MPCFYELCLKKNVVLPENALYMLTYNELIFNSFSKFIYFHFMCKYWQPSSTKTGSLKLSTLVSSIILKCWHLHNLNFGSKIQKFENHQCIKMRERSSLPICVSGEAKSGPPTVLCPPSMVQAHWNVLMGLHSTFWTPWQLLFYGS